eukprot:811534-Rhodomonas_salina.1
MPGTTDLAYRRILGLARGQWRGRVGVLVLTGRVRLQWRAHERTMVGSRTHVQWRARTCAQADARTMAG